MSKAAKRAKASTSNLTSESNQNLETLSEGNNQLAKNSIKKLDTGVIKLTNDINAFSNPNVKANQNPPVNFDNVTSSNVSPEMKSIKGDYFKPFDTNSMLNSLENEEKQKTLLTTIGKFFAINNESNNQIQFNTDYYEKNKRHYELKEKVDNLENDNKILLKSYLEKENDYIEKIKKLEKQFMTSDKADILLLQKQNKDYETQIVNMNKAIQITAEKNHKESEKFKGMIGELLMVKDQIQAEIDEIRKIKVEIDNLKTKDKEVITTRNPNKIKLVMKYSAQDEKKEDLSNQGINKYQIKKRLSMK